MSKNFCLLCGKEFETKNRKKYCSYSCSHKGWYFINIGIREKFKLSKLELEQYKRIRGEDV